MNYEVENKSHKSQAFLHLLKIMNELRAQCPWDKKQTWQSLSSLTIEEVYELTDALSKENANDVKEELGDIMLHIVFYCKIAEEQYGFDIADVLEAIGKKLVSRHPHIYSDTVVNDEEDVKKNWEMLKKKEGKTSVLSGIPAGLPAMVKAFRIQEKTAKVGFDWNNRKDVLKKVFEEIEELENEISNENISKAHVESEFGDVLFALINYARFINVDPEMALSKTNHKFMQRFKFIEQKAETQKTKLEELDLSTMDNWWNEAKKQGL